MGLEQEDTGMERSVGKASHIPDAADSTWEGTVQDTVQGQARWLEELTPERRSVLKTEQLIVPWKNSEFLPHPFSWWPSSLLVQASQMQ